jgi:hypothetical protein
MHSRFQSLPGVEIALKVDSQKESRYQPKVRKPRIDHDIGKHSFAASFILCEQAPDIIQILHSPLWIIHKSDNLQKHQGGRRNHFQPEIWRKLNRLIIGENMRNIPTGSS